VAADFGSDDVGQRLIAAGLDPSVRSLLLCEGIAVYLELPLLTSLLEGLRAVAAADSRLVISLSVSSGSPGLADRRADFQAAVAALGEPARTVLTAADAEVLLGDAGWRGAFPPIEPGADPERAHRAGFVTALTA